MAGEATEVGALAVGLAAVGRAVAGLGSAVMAAVARENAMARKARVALVQEKVIGAAAAVRPAKCGVRP